MPHGVCICPSRARQFHTHKAMPATRERRGHLARNPTRRGRQTVANPTIQSNHVSFEEYFWLHVERRGEDECWPWRGPRFSDFGYGRLCFEGRDDRTHRLAYQFCKGVIPKGQVVRHTCDNPPCCNPRHLILGSQGDNCRDMHERKRVKNRRPTNPTWLRAFNVQRFTPAERRHIRQEHAAGLSMRKLAAQYECNLATIFRTVHPERRKEYRRRSRT